MMLRWAKTKVMFYVCYKLLCLIQSLFSFLNHSLSLYLSLSPPLSHSLSFSFSLHSYSYIFLSLFPDLFFAFLTFIYIFLSSTIILSRNKNILWTLIFFSFHLFIVESNGFLTHLSHFIVPLTQSPILASLCSSSIFSFPLSLFRFLFSSFFFSLYFSLHLFITILLHYLFVSSRFCNSLLISSLFSFLF